MTETIDEGRRGFLKTGAAVGGGLVVGFYLPSLSRIAQAEPAADTLFAPNAWIRIASDDTVTIFLAKSEMGQGAMTSIPTLIAEELGVDLAKVNIEMAPLQRAYVNPIFGIQLTGSSTSIRSSWTPLREAGAGAREMLKAAAAETWGVEPDDCRVEDGAVLHDGSGQRLSYGALAEKAATLPPADFAFTKDLEECTLIGESIPRVDTPKKVDGRAVYGMDVQVPGMLVGTIAHCPVFGGKPAEFDDKATRKVKGVRHVVQTDTGVAVVADSYWSAKRGLDALTVEWDEGPNAAVSSAGITAAYKAAAEEPGDVTRGEGDVAKAMDGAAKHLEMVYELPYLAHATMEPMNCTAHVRADGCDIWAPTQAQSWAQQVAAKITGLEADTIKVHTTFLGGGFGRRTESDYVADAVQVAKAVGVPVKLIWSREEDMRHDFYRPATYNRVKVGLDADGMPVAWDHQVVGPSIMARVAPRAPKPDATSVEGVANMVYGIPNLRVGYVLKDLGIPVGFWRSVGNSYNAFVVESVIDEIAAAGGHDPFELRQKLLENAPRHRVALELAAEKAGWGSPLPEGRFRGIAVHESYASYSAQVAEVSVGKDGQVRVHKVVCAIDCGIVVHPGIVEAQMMSGIVYGITALLKGEITIKDGRVEQENFHDYPLLRMNETPEVEVHIVESEDFPGGAGEPGTPPVAPAVCNAVFAATGKRVRTLPLRPEALRGA